MAAVALAGCSSPIDVSTAERAVQATCQELERLAGVSRASCVVDDGGFDAGVSRRTTIEIESAATAEQAQKIISTWSSSTSGGSEEYGIQGSRATPLELTLDGTPSATFSVAPGAPAPGVVFVEEWLSRARGGIPITGSITDTRRIAIAEDGLSPSAQVALLDEFGMQTRTDGLVLEIGAGSSATNTASSFEAPVSETLHETLKQFDSAYHDLSESDPARELAFTVDAAPGQAPRLEFRIPADLVPDVSADRPVVQAPAWPTIRALLEAAAPSGPDYALRLTARPGDVIGSISTSGCVPELRGPQPRYTDELQAQWATIHNVPAPDACE